MKSTLVYEILPAGRTFQIGNVSRTGGLMKVESAKWSVATNEELGELEFCFWRESFPSSFKEPNAFPGTESLLVRNDLVGPLLVGIEDYLENLPVTVEGGPWTLVRPKAEAGRLDVSRSDLIVFPPSLSGAPCAVIRHAVIEDDPLLHDAIFLLEARGARACSVVPASALERAV